MAQHRSATLHGIFFSDFSFNHDNICIARSRIADYKRKNKRPPDFIILPSALRVHCIKELLGYPVFYKEPGKYFVFKTNRGKK